MYFIIKHFQILFISQYNSIIAILTHFFNYVIPITSCSAHELHQWPLHPWFLLFTQDSVSHYPLQSVSADESRQSPVSHYLIKCHTIRMAHTLSHCVWLLACNVSRLSVSLSCLSFLWSWLLSVFVIIYCLPWPLPVFGLPLWITLDVYVCYYLPCLSDYVLWIMWHLHPQLHCHDSHVTCYNCNSPNI